MTSLYTANERQTSLVYVKGHCRALIGRDMKGWSVLGVHLCSSARERCFLRLIAILACHKWSSAAIWISQYCR